MQMVVEYRNGLSSCIVAKYQKKRSCGCIILTTNRHIKIKRTSNWKFIKRIPILVGLTFFFLLAYIGNRKELKYLMLSCNLSGDIDVDSKPGHLIEGNSVKVPRMMLSPLGSSKRTRPRQLYNGVHTTMCHVDGCNADLSNCMEYHRRRKVCEAHSGTPEIRINCHKQHSCQQCCRFD
ncbi:hypothetical protein POM88_004593 [Heracleum sosnowskyi]|uniref:SBP-type domain-containing protein n=1 Tax=Heracleum sosnowskyi TaxID=360622 RepID=A0AAD8NEK2_9APIA|nr:hypothetical protein POM88_004593 [Heracleum sosnowskyi]